MFFNDSDVPPEGLIAQESPEFEHGDAASEANLDGSVGESSTNEDESDTVSNHDNEDIGMDINLNEDTDMDQPQGLPHHDTAELRRESLSPVETGVPEADVESLQEFAAGESSHTHALMDSKSQEKC